MAMSKDLLAEVQTKLAVMRPAELKQMAESVGSVSFSLLSKIARKKYNSSLAYTRLRDCAEYLRKRRGSRAA